MLFTILFSFIISWTSWFFPNSTQADETYQVIFVQGTIINKATGATIAKGAKLSAKDKVSFRSKDAKAVILSTTRGRFVMTGKPAAGGSEFIAFVNDVVSPLKTNAKLSTRGMGLMAESGIQDMETFFGVVRKDSEGKILNLPIFAMIGDKYAFKVDISRYPMNAEKFLGIYYESPKKVGKAIGFKGNVATLSKEGHFVSKGVDPKDVEFVEIRQYNKATNNFEKDVLASFRPIFIDPIELKETFQEFVNLSGDKDETLRDYMKSAVVYADDAEKTKKEQEIADKVKAMNEADKKRELLFYFLASCYGNMTEEGVVDVANFNMDGQSLEMWLKDNNL
ncbi:MAG: hypothetical protein MUE85_04950 [Microscillaceae bacterium]|jgi:hypothetical protein|nr:hypothetical protein [Microscillaceae bacterium]